MAEGVRYGLMVRTCVEVLRGSGEPMSGREVLDAVAKRVDLNEAELAAQFNAFLRLMRDGDFVLTVHRDDVHLGLVDGPPTLDLADPADGMSKAARRTTARSTPTWPDARGRRCCRSRRTARSGGGAAGLGGRAHIPGGRPDLAAQLARPGLPAFAGPPFTSALRLPGGVIDPARVHVIWVRQGLRPAGLKVGVLRTRLARRAVG